MSQSVGDQWVSEDNSPVLKVPSVVVPEGINYLLNIAHGDFGKIESGNPIPMDFDSRLIK
ncbi:RES family NAD+ phosphorylase [Desulfopila sp. IMCC35008]|uniref:RES family NAD+ phosphorylase n=1 Tax=Desulfopila sp. IMCC35008 TaxID=2653858 RepID=UPI00351706BA